MANKQVFIIGCPRSGTTFLLNLMASNTRFAWVSKEMDKQPFAYELAEKLKVFSKFYFGKKSYFNAGRRGLPTPVEAWNFWNTHFSYFQWHPQFSPVPRNAFPGDSNDEEIQNTRAAVNKICSFAGKDFFLSKYTDYPRVQLIRSAFPEAKFIHIVRDGRAVANSYKKMIESGTFNTAKEEQNWLKAWKPEWQNQYLSKYHSPLAFTIYQWKHFVTEIKEELKVIPQNDFIEITYEQLIENSEDTTNFILNFLNVKMDANMRYFLKHKAIDDNNTKWRQQFSENEKQMALDIIEEDYLKKYLEAK